MIFQTKGPLCCTTQYKRTIKVQWLAMNIQNHLTLNSRCEVRYRMCNCHWRIEALLEWLKQHPQGTSWSSWESTSGFASVLFTEAADLSLQKAIKCPFRKGSHPNTLQQASSNLASPLESRASLQMAFNTPIVVQIMCHERSKIWQLHSNSTYGTDTFDSTSSAWSIAQPSTQHRCQHNSAKPLQSSNVSTTEHAHMEKGIKHIWSFAVSCGFFYCDNMTSMFLCPYADKQPIIV